MYYTAAREILKYLPLYATRKTIYVKTIARSSKWLDYFLVYSTYDTLYTDVNLLPGNEQR